VINIQAQDSSGNWRTYAVTNNNPQQIRVRMEEIKRQYPNYRVRAVDNFGVVVDIL
jgi:hypothetical protein